ncbi:MAG: hypothetical protein EOO88_09005 [Pedobacter sp.]|nr:MAG: hypothetical protein EOO88_09005 [Pedobacter sp.]
MDNELLTPPGDTEEDDLIQLARDVIGMIPFGGGIATVLFNQIVPDPFKARLERVMAKVCLRLNELNEGKGLPWERIKSDPNFQIALVQAYRQIQETTMKEKLEAYENALVNVTLDSAITETKITLFFNLLERFTVLHLFLLKFLHDPATHINAGKFQLPKSSTPSHHEIFQAVIPDVLVELDLTMLIMNELTSYSLIEPNSFEFAIPVKTYLGGQTTRFGKEFVNFISNTKK